MKLAAKFLTKFLICTLVTMHVAPLPVVAGEGDDIFVLPEGRAGTYYQVKIQDVLRERYNLKLETGQRAGLFRWSFADGEMPPGLLMRPSGTLTGIPRAPRDEPYQFRAKVVDASVASGGFLILTLSLKLDAPRIRLSRVEAPRLVPLNKGVPAADAAPRPTQAFVTPNFFAAPESRPAAQPSTGRTSDVRAGMTTPPAEHTFAGQFESVNTSAASDASGGEGASSAAAQVVACAGAPQRPTGKVFVIDARNGDTRGKRDFKRGETVNVVVANKNPYLYKYTFNANTRFIEETALGKFLPLLGGIITDLTADNKYVTDKANANPRGANPLGGGSPVCNSTEFRNALTTLETERNQAVQFSDDITKGIKKLGQANKARKDKYDPLRKVLLNAQSTDTELYCTSKALLEVPEPGADANEIESLKKDVEALRVLARSFQVRADLLGRTYPACTDPTQISSIRVAAEGFLALADKYDKSLKTIGDELKKMDDIKETVEKVSSDPRNFMETHEFGPYRRTTEVTLALQRTSLAEENAKAQDLVKADATVLKFGEAPFFSISGGLVFSPLRKREFIRIQGFERDLQGDLVLADGKPNLTTIVGLKEDSSSRIAPLIMLNGRLPNSQMGPIDGWHISLGITGKNDNKGTDIEYLVGPSVSMLEDNLFLTFGGYAGKQQKLGGNLFEGAAVPAGVDELPIEKNYRWNFGFALTYKLPIGK